MLFFNRKHHKNDRVLAFNHAELRIVMTALIRFRNRAIRDHLPTEDIDGLIALLHE